MSILDQTVHARLIADMTHLCRLAGIPEMALHHSAQGVCSPQEISWIRDFPKYRAQGKGLLLNGVRQEQRCIAITAALMRNFVDARLIPLHTLLVQVEKDAAPNPTVLVVPNLFVRHAGKALPAWRVNALYDYLLSRVTEGRPSVVYVEDYQAMAAEYGGSFAQHIAHNYLSAGA